MKIIKIIGSLILVLIVLIIGTLVWALSSAGFQTGMVRRVAPDGVQVERVHFGFRGLAIDLLAIEHEGAIVELDRARITFPLMRTLLRRELHIEEFVLSGLRLDLSAVVTEDADEITVPDDPVSIERVYDIYEERPRVDPDRAVEPIPFDGLFREEFLWPPVRVDRLAIDAEVRLPGGQQTVTVEVGGSEIGTAAESTIAWSVNFSDAGEDAVLTQASLSQTAAWRLSDASRIVGVAITLEGAVELLHEGHVVPLHVAVSVGADQHADQNGEEYAIVILLGANETATDPVVVLDAAYEYDVERLAGEWSIDFASDRLAALTEQYLQGAVATIGASGRFVVTPATGSAEKVGTLEFSATGLDQWVEELAALPSISATLEYDLAVDARTSQVHALQLAVRGGDETLLMLQAEQPFGIEFDGMKPLIDDPDRPLLRLALLAVPVEVINALTPDMDLFWAALTGELLVTVVQERFVVSSAVPLTVQGLTLAMDGEPILDNVTLEIPLHATVDDDHAEFEVDALRLSAAGSEFIHVVLRGQVTEFDSEEPHLDVAANWRVDLPTLLAQPVAIPFRNIQQGKLHGELTAQGVAAALEGRFQTRFVDVVLPDERRVNEVRVDAHFALQEDDRIELRIPVRSVAGSERSELQLAVNLQIGDPLTVTVDGRGETVWVDHFLVFADGFQNPDYQAPPSPEVDHGAEDGDERDETPDAGEPSPHETAELPPDPPWVGVQADLDLAIAEVRIGGQPPIHDVVLVAHVDESSVRVNSFRARIDQSPLTATAQISFAPAVLQELYRLQAELQLTGFDVGGYLRESQPDTSPPVEAIVSVDVNVQGAAPSLEALAEEMVGHFRVTATDAVVRAFRQGRTGRALDAAAAGRIGGMLTGREDVDAVGELVSYFNRIEFDELTLEAQRNPDLAIEITRLVLRNAELQMVGTGVVAHVEGREFHQQPIALSFDVGVRPPLDRLFDKLDLLAVEAHEDGYRRVNRPLQIEGNVGEPDPRPFWAIILDAGTRRILPDRRRPEAEDSERERDREPRSPLDRLQRYL